ncbi:MAG: SpoIIE family protein phosphatase [Verrucomicrobia bacterium]|nr:SpoIIE family protein phosphatase [Verrucomicrobiota bacterium]
MSLRKQLNRLVAPLLLVATVVALVLANFTLSGLLRDRSGKDVHEQNGAVSRLLDQRLASYAEQLRLISSLPLTDGLLAVASRRDISTTDLETRWSLLSRGDTEVRNVLDNELGQILNQIAEGRSDIIQITLTDSEGHLVAASDKPAAFGFKASDWWIHAKAMADGKAVAEGLDSEGRIVIALAVFEVQRGEVSGVMAMTVDIEPFIRSLPEMAPVEVCTMLIGESAIYAAGSRDVFAGSSETLAAQFRDNTAARGWANETRYLGVIVRGNMDWARPVWVATAKREGRFSTSYHIPMFLCIAVSAFLVIVLVVMLTRSGSWNPLRPYEVLTAAGQWVLHNALLLEEEPADDAVSALPTLKESKLTPSSVRTELDEWYHRFERDLQDEVTLRTHEMQRDLNLARDFQQAYLNRPYPTIPAVHIEGHLRLEFYHRYQPALALGGDFFDINTLARDCAGLFIADVMGHGTRSALITAILRTLIGDLTPQGRNARHFITEMNRQFCDMVSTSPQPLFASAFYFIADTTSRVATFTTAGHPAPFHISRSLSKINRLEVPSPQGAALGLIPTETYTAGHCRLIPGDVFILFTDGVFETANKDGDEFGLIRMEKTLRKYMYKGVSTIVDGVMSELLAFAGDEQILDDICMVACEVTTAPRETASQEEKKETPSDTNPHIG